MDCCGEKCDFTSNKTKEHLLWHIKNKYPTNIRFNERHLLPDRVDLLDQSLVSIFKGFISANKPILFMPNDITEPMVYDRNVQVYQPYLYGILPCGTKVAVILKDIDVYFDIKLPDEPTLMTTTIDTKLTKKNEDFIEQIKTSALVNNHILVKTEIVYLFPSNRHSLVKHPYLRLYFNNLKSRSDFFNIVVRENPGITTASDDKHVYGKVCYFSKAAREYKFAVADWNRIEKYNICATNKTNCTYTFEVSVKDMVPLSTDRRKAMQENVSNATSIALGKSLDYDNTIVCQWDIETKGDLPDYTIGTRRKSKVHFNTKNFKIFMMNTSYFQQWSTTPLLNVCCVDNELSLNGQSGDETKNSLVSVICGNERNVLEAHMFVLSKIKPDILSAFNGGHFDWPVYREKLYSYGILGDLKRSISCLKEAEKYYENDNVYDYSFKENIEIKLSAERTHVMKCVAIFPGMIDTDVMASFLKLYSRAEISKAGSLNFFLKENNLESKEDMPYKRMFKIHDRSCELVSAPKECHCRDSNLINSCPCCKSIIPVIDCIEDETKDYDNPERYSTDLLPDLVGKCCYCGKRPRNLKDMELIAIYCMIDCVRPQELNVARSVIGEKRALANLTCVPLYNTFYFADGEKVRNLLAGYCYNYGVAFSNITLDKHPSQKDHNVGGFVVAPKRGLYRVPITGLDFESLYPSIIATYNLSTDMIVNDADYAKFLQELGYNLYPITDESGEYLQYTRGEKKDDPSNQVLRSKAWSVRHNGILKETDTHIIVGYDDNLKPIYGREKLPCERLGYVAYIAILLKELRRPIKAQLIKYMKLKEALEIERDGTTNPARIEEITKQISDADFQIKNYTSKSNSIKLVNNTIYGQIASFRNSFYDINIAGGITAAGRRNLKMVKLFVESLGFGVVYGDTDSLYITCPDEIYDAIREKYGCKDPNVIPPEKFYHDMVKIAMESMKQLGKDVFKLLVKNNGTLFLIMAYEEVCLPCSMFGKKKYACIAHTDEPNFYPDELFIRGLELKKQGQTGISKELQMTCLRDILSITHLREPIDVAKDHIKRFFTIQMDSAKFAKMYSYRPNKKNTTVLRFVERMREQKKPVPDAGDKFKAVVVRKRQQFTIRGTMVKMLIGDQLEYLHEFNQSLGGNDPMELDLEYYLDGGIYGAFARFISYHPDFQKPGLDMSDPEEYKIGDTHSVSEAYSFLEKECAKFITKDNTADKALSKTLKSDYKNASNMLASGATYDKTIKNGLSRAIGGVKATNGDISHPMLYMEKLRENIQKEHTDSLAKRFIVIALKTQTIFELKKSFDFRTRNLLTTRIVNNLMAEVLQILPKSWAISDAYKQRIDTAVSNGITEPVSLTEDEQKILYNTDKLISRFRAAIFCKRNILAIDRLISEEVVRKTDTEYVPRIDVRAISREESKYVSTVEEYVFQ